MDATAFSMNIFIGSVIILSCLCTIHSYTDKQTASQKGFTWQPEAWRSCHEGKTCEEPGIRRRSLGCLNEEGEKTPHRNCDRKTRPKRREACVAAKCRNHTVFKMEISSWEPCKAQPLLTHDVLNLLIENSTIEVRNTINHSKQDYIYLGHENNWKKSLIGSCGALENVVIYVKRRNISCYAHWPRKNLRLKTTVENCSRNPTTKPKTIQLCSFGCKQKCSVGQWSGWEASPLLPPDQKYRRRQITYYPYLNDSLEVCPSLVELSRDVKFGSGKGQGIQLVVSAWSDCKRNDTGADHAHLMVPKVGLRTRTVSCALTNGKRGRCERNESRDISTSEACTIPRDCQVAQWGEWSSCYPVFPRTTGEGGKVNAVEFYQRHRVRYTVVTQLAKGKACPNLKETIRCENSMLHGLIYKNGSVANSSYQWFAGEFSMCQPDKKDCRSGIKIRSVFCIRQGDADFNPVGLHLCAHLNKPAGKVFCRNPCKETCALGEWNSWSGCTADCRGGAKGVVRGTHYRVRRVVQYSGDPRSCEDYAESRPCTLTNCVSWVAGTQTICLLDDVHRACGNGKTHRAVYCMNAKGQQVDDSQCQGDMPSRSLACHVPCSDDCVVGAWSDWGPCEGKCGKNGTQGESFRTRRRNILAYPGWSGRPCPVGKGMTEQQSCLGESCGTYRWKVDEWSLCTVKRDGQGRLIKDNNKGRCMVGNRLRAVKCISNEGEKVLDNLCSTFLKPQEDKECRICVEDCILSPWSKWSVCPEECLEKPSHVQPIRKRERFIIRRDKGGGTACPRLEALTQLENCRSCDDYQWYVGRWSNCITAEGEDCSGVKTRLVYCERKSGPKVEPDGLCLLRKPKPEEISTCAKNCAKRCILTEWTNWGGCSKECGTGYARRTRSSVGNSIRCSSNVTLSEDRTCNQQQCGLYSLRSSAWSQCYAKDSKRGCGAGKQWRNITCYKISGPKVPLQYCIEELYGGKMTLNFERDCMVSCPFDCKLSSWTAYTPCSRKCGSGVKTRFRTIVQEATYGGQMCAGADGEKQVTEMVPCVDRQCFNFVWRTDPWETCRITNQTRSRVTQCGTGYHTRKVYCTDSRFSGRMARINDSLCDAQEKPATKDACVMFCPGDCVVGQWTSWSRCSSICPRPGHRRRERTVLRYPAHDGKNCPVLEQHEPCNLKNCYTHHWRTTPWSSCIYYTDDTSCGVGTQRRLADCVRSDGKIAHAFYCRVEGRRVPSLLRMCTVPCPRNCELSEWGAWTSCPDKCNAAAVQRRTRFVLAQAENGGQSCLESDSLQEFRSCPMMPCFSVHVGDWGECASNVEKICGFGTMKREVYCMRDDGRLVDDSHCVELASGLIPKEDTCKVPCKGDCVTTHWTRWSSCFGLCTVKNESIFHYGVRVRTRHVLQHPTEHGERCPRDMVQMEKCGGPLCFTFTWRTGPYVDKKRNVWCIRSDGLTVSTGCSLAYKPSATQSCEPKCRVTHSFCNSETICVCKKDYIPIFSSHGHLIHCLSDPNTFRNRTKDNNIPTNKSSSGEKDSSWFADLPIIIWIVIGVCFVYFLLFLAIVIVYTRRRKSRPRERRASTADVGTLTNPERRPLTEQKHGHQRTDSKMSFATSSGRGSTLSAISDHDDAEQWPRPPENVVVSEFIRQHLKNFNTGSFCSTFSDESLQDKSQMYSVSRGTSFDAAGTL